jgi:hypothetical protein
MNKFVDIFEDFTKGKDILITIPSTIEWSDYQKELDQVKNGDVVMNFKVGNLPTKTFKGNRCYLVYNGNIIGWMTIVGFSEKEFNCGSTGKSWKGKFIERSGEFHKIIPIPYKGFQGFRYITDELKQKIGN